MCDIAGFFHGQSAELLNPVITRMYDRIYHRGPGHSGDQIDQSAGLALDHRGVEAASITGSIICGVF